ncbi:MAG TPA: DUF533 domain-containing protein [Steroidobacteraceae bacterium]|nr:DUF533 domain-containing protein [Steroidobacteraceae bacterium]
MLDTKRLVDALLSSGIASGVAGGMAGGLLTSAVTGKRGKKFAKSAVKVGGLALIGTIAWQAWRKHQAGRTAAATARAPVQPDGPASLPAPFDLGRRPRAAMRVVEAMIAAARADGAVDAEERRQIFSRLAEAELNTTEQSFLLSRLASPVDLDALVRDVESPELALEMYAAAALVVAPAGPADRAFLDLLAARLGVEPTLARSLDTELASYALSGQRTAANAERMAGDAA